MNPYSSSAPARRVDWADYAKGFCIIMVVMMHSTLGVEEAAGREGFMHALVAFAKPFRMPDFFMISGLFLSRVIDRDWRTYLDRKVVHFAYFYVLWVTIQFAVKAPMFAAAHGWDYVAAQYALAFIEPFGTLWFIYLLPIFFVVTKAARRVPPAVIWFAAAALQIAAIDTGWTAIDEFAGRFVYFYTGYLFAPRIFAFAAVVQARPGRAAAGLVAWALVNGALVYAGACRMAGRLARARARRRGGGDRVLRADGESPDVRAGAVLRAAFDRHLSRLLPAHGGDAHGAAQDRHRARCRRPCRSSSPPPASSARSRCGGPRAPPARPSCSSGPARFWIAPRPRVAMQPAE